MKTHLLLFIFSGLFIGCNQTSTKKNTQSNSELSIPVIDLDNALKNISKTPYKCSEFIEDIEFLPLETNTESLLGKNKFFVSILGTPEFVYYDLNKFSLKDGKFIYQVGKRGRGPGEYTLAIGSTTAIEDNRVFVQDNQTHQVLIYDNSNNFIKKLNVLDGIGGISYLGADKLVLFNGSESIYPNTVPFEYHIYDLKEDRIIYTREILDIKKAWQNKSGKIFGSHGIRRNSNWYFKNKVQFFESYSDTIYTIEANCTRTPRFYVKRKNYKPPLSELFDTERYMKNRPKYIEIVSFFETPRYLFLKFYKGGFEASYIARFDKVKRETMIVSEIGAFENDLAYYKFHSFKNCIGTFDGIEYMQIPIHKEDILSKMEEIPKVEWKEPAKRFYDLIKIANPGDNGIICIYKFKNENNDSF